MEIKTQLSVEMSNEEYDGAVQSVVRAIGQAAKSVGHFDLSLYSEEDIKRVGEAAFHAVLSQIFRDKVDVKPPF